MSIKPAVPPRPRAAVLPGGGQPRPRPSRPRISALRSLVGVFGHMLMLVSLLYLLPIACALIYGDGMLLTFVAAMGICLGAGALLALVGIGRRPEIRARHGFLLVTLTWVLISAITAVPLMLALPMSFTDAFFEAMSGLTTTGATVITGLDHLAPSLNLWRHVLQWLGGMGIIVLAVAILPALGVGGMQLMRAEVPGPIKDTRLTPRIADTAAALWIVYAVITAGCVLALKVAGMDWFDAVCHAFAAISLGGFSTRDASVGAFDSPAIEAVLILFMVLAAVNFATHFTAWQKRSARPYGRDAEAVGVVTVLLASCLGGALYLTAAGTYGEFTTALRHVSFNLVSLAVDCGFASTDYAQWPIFVPWWMLFLSGLTASSGSTGGGIKMIRTLILVQQSSRELARMVHPSRIAPLRISGGVVPNSVVFAVLGFVFLYFISVVFLTFLLVLGGLDFISALSAVVACINNAGPGLGEVGPAANYQGLTDYETWVCSFTMLLGRLEVLSLLILFTPTFWRG